MEVGRFVAAGGCRILANATHLSLVLTYEGKGRIKKSQHSLKMVVCFEISLMGIEIL